MFKKHLPDFRHICFNLNGIKRRTFLCFKTFLYVGRLKRKYNIYSQHVSAHQVAFRILLSFKGHQLSVQKLGGLNKELVEDNPTWPRRQRGVTLS